MGILGRLVLFFWLLIILTLNHVAFLSSNIYGAPRKLVKMTQISEQGLFDTPTNSTLSPSSMCALLNNTFNPPLFQVLIPHSRSPLYLSSLGKEIF
ncbi:hypothetical protein BKA64DRAFT_655787 [Cadophora sp. MPI-SDFR-AT-0126]|nr:hypothetical protein BKA64DRAFT_655787 [Leotiomycetes sp. MPI-SDFR-AT-0126]